MLIWFVVALIIFITFIILLVSLADQISGGISVLKKRPNSDAPADAPAEAPGEGPGKPVNMMDQVKARASKVRFF